MRMRFRVSWRVYVDTQSVSVTGLRRPGRRSWSRLSFLRWCSFQRRWRLVPYTLRYRCERRILRRGPVSNRLRHYFDKWYFHVHVHLLLTTRQSVTGFALRERKTIRQKCVENRNRSRHRSRRQSPHRKIDRNTIASLTVTSTLSDITTTPKDTSHTTNLRQTTRQTRLEIEIDTPQLSLSYSFSRLLWSSSSSPLPSLVPPSASFLHIFVYDIVFSD